MLSSFFGKKKEKSSPTEAAKVATVNVLESFQEFDVQYYEEVKNDVRPRLAEAASLSAFWPPVRHFKFETSKSSVSLTAFRFLVDDNDLLNLINTSEVLKSFATFGIEATVSKNSTKDSLVHLIIDASLCPTNNSYELQVGNNQVILVGSDVQGIVYGMYTLLQAIKLYGETTQNEAGVKVVRVPSLVVSDKPDISQRAVLWSCRQQLRSELVRAQEYTELLVRMRMNVVFLVLDLESTSDDDTVAPADVQALQAFLAACKKSFVDVIPTVVFTSINHK
jgi:hypothetical protein